MNKYTLSQERITLTGAGLGAFIVAMQSDMPRTVEAFANLGGKAIVGAIIGAYVTRLVAARLSIFNGPKARSQQPPKG